MLRRGARADRDWNRLGTATGTSTSSCQTAAILLSLRYGGIAAGLISTKLGPSAPIGVLTALLMEAGAEWIDFIRGFSTSNAVYVMRRLVGPSRARTQVLTLMPQ